VGSKFEPFSISRRQSGRVSGDELNQGDMHLPAASAQLILHLQPNMLATLSPTIDPVRLGWAFELRMNRLWILPECVGNNIYYAYAGSPILDSLKSRQIFDRDECGGRKSPCGYDMGGILRRVNLRDVGRTHAFALSVIEEMGNEDPLLSPPW